MAEQQELDVEQIIREYLPQIAHMSLATATPDGRPWTTELHFAYDDDLNLYFCSSFESRHSREARANPCVAGTIVTQHFLNQNVRGIYFEGMIEQLEDVDERHPAYVAYEGRFHKGPQVVRAAREGGKARYYKITVSDFYLQDGYVSSPPQKLHLAWPKSGQ